jgi:hypothetical protein
MRLIQFLAPLAGLIATVRMSLMSCRIPHDDVPFYVTMPLLVLHRYRIAPVLT